MQYKKKLIEVALPLEAINAASAREKSIRHGHPSTLHLWWARRPLATARAVIWSSLVDDPSSHPELFPTEEDQARERERLFQILRELVIWENSNNQEVLNRAKAEIMKSTGGNLPELLDPFAGGGAIPLEAQRLGLKAHASDLNPVAVMINKAMIEIPPRFANMPPVNPEARRLLNKQESEKVYSGAQGLAEDVRYYGEWMKKEALKRIGHLYPKVKDEQGIERTVIAWIWARTVKCPNPACGCEMPLAGSFELSKAQGKEAYIQPVFQNGVLTYTVRRGKKAPNPPKTGRGKFHCICCGAVTPSDYIKLEGRSSRMGNQLMAIVAQGDRERLYLSPNQSHIEVADFPPPSGLPEGELIGKAADQLPLYGCTRYSDLFTHRQLTTLTTFSDLVGKAQQLVHQHAIASGMSKDSLSLSAGGSGSKAYSEAVGVYLAFTISKLADIGSSLVTWNITRDGLRNTFGRQAIPMVWDYAEGNPFSSSSGCFDDGMITIGKSYPVAGVSDTLREMILGIQSNTPPLTSMVDFEIFDGNIAYIRVWGEFDADLTGSGSAPSTLALFQSAVHSAKDAGSQRLILDLRNNVGGLDDMAAALLGSFYAQETFYEYQNDYDYATGTRTIQRAMTDSDALMIQPAEDVYTGQVIALVNQKCISSGEGLALGIRNLPNGETLGFYGTNGSFGLSGSEALMPGELAIKWPAGQSLDENMQIQVDSRGGIGGVAPTIRIPMTLERALLVAQGEDVELAQALAILRGDR